MRTTIAVLSLGWLISGSAALASEATCPGNNNALGVSRVVEINTEGGPGFGFEHYKVYDFLAPGEVVLTFDDGPLPGRTRAVLKALASHCTKGIFFPVGKLVVGYPEVLKEVANQGHTVGSHTWAHVNLSKMKTEQAKDEIEKGFSAVRLAVGDAAASFFRFSYLKDTPDLIAHLGKRNVAIFSTDIDSFDFKIKSPKKLIRRILAKLKRKGKGILLFHDIQPVTVKALPALLKALKSKGYKVVQLKSKDSIKTLPNYDAEVAKTFKGRLANAGGRPLSAVVRTISTSTQ